MADNSIHIRTIQFKRGLKDNLEAKLRKEALGVLAAGEPAYEIDTGKLKVGDGKSDYINLPYISKGSLAEDDRFEIQYPLKDQQIFVYDSSIEKWVNRDISDNSTITYLKEQGITLKNYDSAEDGEMPVKDPKEGLRWVPAVTADQLNAATAAAEESKIQAGSYATQAGNSAIAAEHAAQQAQVINNQTMR